MSFIYTLMKIFRRDKNGDQNAGSTPIPLPDDMTTIKDIPIDFDLNILVIADTHGRLSEQDIKNKDADVCFLLGDMSKEDILLVKQHVAFPIYGVLGNHDGWDLYDTCGIENIHNKVVTVNGVRIIGFQGSLRYKNTDFPFYTDEESVVIANEMDSADIIISHDSPKYFHGCADDAHSGLQGITEYCKRNMLPLNIHGHHHENIDGILENGTTVLSRYGVSLIKVKQSL